MVEECFWYKSNGDFITKPEPTTEAFEDAMWELEVGTGWILLSAKELSGEQYDEILRVLNPHHKTKEDYS